MDSQKIVFTGSGGQGLITAAILLGEAAVLHEGLEAVQSQSYGAAARGGSTRSDVIISNRRINIPKAFQPGVLICLTQEAYNTYSSIIRPGGLLITDKRYVKVARKVDARQVELNLYQTVLERVGTPVVFNISVLGALIGMRPMVRKESVLQVLAERFPPSFAKSNTEALELGFELGCVCQDEI
ncbi:MAG: 2-oxoglutarate ferredoxin oxidoreductase subunit gamma [Desulfobacterales bacterium GWB2_56_26]|nr:MAG: 2-oxoglutarate ferredoxin oxidoreductase subunit gamma [Desulfobacterales bacterium GWB2_56_26]